MSEDNNNQNDQPTEEQQPSDETQTKFFRITKNMLKQILNDHKKWLASGGKEGKRAELKKVNLVEFNLKGTELSKANFEKADLSNVNMKHAFLRKANFRKANLGGCNLKFVKLNGADLQKVNFDGAELQEANLFKANLRKADLSKANLQETFLNRANLHKAELYEANLQKATLLRANLQKAILSNANLHKANLGKSNMQNTELEGIKGLNEAENLQYADFQGATGLLGNEFAQADVTGTKLPDDIKEFKALDIVEKTSQNARKIFFAMLLGCVYSWLTIATTTDVRLLTNTASSPLPIIGTEIPIAWFYIAAPLVLMCLYFYFHLYLDTLWGALASLPAIFPDGKRLDERAYPWLLNTLVRKHFKRLKSRPLIARMKEWITIFLAWWVVPITMIYFWIRFIPRHDWIGTIFHIGLIVLSVAFAIIFYRLCALTLKGKKKVSIKIKKFWSDKGFYYSIFKIILFSFFIFSVGLLFSLISVGAINGIRAEKQYKPLLDDLYSIEKVVPWAFEKIGYDVFADFSEKDVSEKPDNYWEITENNQIQSVKRANLKNRNLKNADMVKAYLVKADLRNALLHNANLSNAILHNALLINANLQKANLLETNLRQALLEGAKLQEASLYKANLQEANLIFAKLDKAELRFTNLRQANLENATLLEAILEEANLQQANLLNTNLQKANLLNANLQQAVLEGANLQEAKLQGANLQQANIYNTNLTEANLEFAKLQQAELGYTNLQEANLLKAKNLTIDQLSKVKTLYQAKLDPELLEQVKKCCQHLLEKPKNETDRKDYSK